MLPPYMNERLWNHFQTNPHEILPTLRFDACIDLLNVVGYLGLSEWIEPIYEQLKKSLQNA